MSGDSSVLHNKALIANNLGLLQKEKAMLSVPLGGKNVLLTAVIGIDTKKDLLFLDTSSSEVLNKLSVTAKRVQCSCTWNGVKVSFNLEQLSRTKHGGYDAFVARIPDSVYWFDRRGAFRVKVPYTSSSICKLKISPPEDSSTLEYRKNFENVTNIIRQKLANQIQKNLIIEQQEFEKAYLKMTPEEKIRAKLERENIQKERQDNPPVPDEELVNILEFTFIDLSMTGCALINHSRNYSYFLTQGIKYQDCVLIFSEQTKEGAVTKEVIVNIEIMLQREIEEHADRMYDYHEMIGIKFIEPTQATESVIFRYIQSMDRIAKNRRDI